MRLPWPVLSGVVHCRGLSDIGVLINDISGQLERDGLSKLDISGPCLQFRLAFPMIARLSLSGFVSSGHIGITTDSGGITVRYGFCWRRALICAVLAVAMVFLAALFLTHGAAKPSFPDWVVCTGGAVVLSYIGSRIASKAFVRSCVRYAGGEPC